MSDEPDDNVTPLPTKRTLPDDRPPRNLTTRVQRALVRQKITNLVLGGATEQEIAKALDLTPKRVTVVLGQILNSWESAEQANVDKVRALQLARVDRLLRAHWPAAVGIGPNGTQVPPSRQAAEFCLKAEMLRSDLAGTKAAKRVEISGTIGIEMHEGEIERLDQAWLNSGGDVIDGTATELDSIAADG